MIKVLIYENRNNEELLWTLRDFTDMVRDYQFFSNSIFVAQAYKFFATTVKGQVNETWNSVLNNLIVAPAGQQDVAVWQAHQTTFLIKIISTKACNNQQDYLI